MRWRRKKEKFKSETRNKYNVATCCDYGSYKYFSFLKQFLFCEYLMMTSSDIYNRMMVHFHGNIKEKAKIYDFILTTIHYPKCTIRMFYSFSSLYMLQAHLHPFAAYFSWKCTFCWEMPISILIVDNTEKCPFILHRFPILLPFRITCSRFLFLCSIV